MRARGLRPVCSQGPLQPGSEGRFLPRGPSSAFTTCMAGSVEDPPQTRPLKCQVLHEGAPGSALAAALPSSLASPGQ